MNVIFARRDFLVCWTPGFLQMNNACNRYKQAIKEHTLETNLNESVIFTAKILKLKPFCQSYNCLMNVMFARRDIRVLLDTWFSSNEQCVL